MMCSQNNMFITGLHKKNAILMYENLRDVTIDQLMLDTPLAYLFSDQWNLQFGPDGRLYILSSSKTNIAFLALNIDFVSENSADPAGEMQYHGKVPFLVVWSLKG